VGQNVFEALPLHPHETSSKLTAAFILSFGGTP